MIVTARRRLSFPLSRLAFSLAFFLVASFAFSVLIVVIIPAVVHTPLVVAVTAPITTCRIITLTFALGSPARRICGRPRTTSLPVLLLAPRLLLLPILLLMLLIPLVLVVLTAPRVLGVNFLAPASVVDGDLRNYIVESVCRARGRVIASDPASLKTFRASMSSKLRFLRSLLALLTVPGSVAIAMFTFAALTFAVTVAISVSVAVGAFSVTLMLGAFLLLFLVNKLKRNIKHWTKSENVN